MSKRKKSGDIQLAPAAEKTTVGEGKFAIKTASIFKFDANSTTVKVNPSGTVDITLSFGTDAGNVFGAGADISDFDSGVFTIATPNHFFSAVVSPLSLFQDAHNKISLKPK
jgi:hypothetical protein